MSFSHHITSHIKCHLNADHKGKAHSNNTHKYLMSTKIFHMYAIVQHIYELFFLLFFNYISNILIQDIAQNMCVQCSTSEQELYRLK